MTAPSLSLDHARLFEVPVLWNGEAARLRVQWAYGGWYVEALRWGHPEPLRIFRSGADRFTWKASGWTREALEQAPFPTAQAAVDAAFATEQIEAPRTGRNQQGDSVKDDEAVEVTVRLTGDEVRTLRGWDGARGWPWMGDRLRDALPDPEPPAPERTEYPLQRITESQFNGRTVIHDFDEVLVAAHSLRVGDHIEWAPGDWREITEVRAHSNTVMAVYTAVGLLHLARPTLVAVRR